VNTQPRSRPTKMPAGLGLVLLFLFLLFLALSQSQQPAFSQDIEPAEIAGSPNVLVEPAAARVPCPDNPIPPAPGQIVPIVRDEEILLSFRQANDQKAMANTLINNKLGTSQLEIVWPEPWWTSLPNLANISWLANTTGDLNGDGIPELISAFKNSNSQLGALSWSTAVVNPRDWYSASSRFVGKSLSWIDVAAGNLDRKDNDDEIVIAFKDALDDIHVVAIDGSKTTPGDVGTQIAEWWKDDLERGSVNHVSVATGDLDGDGVNDEIVVAYKDSGNDLQVQILQLNGSVFEELWRIDSRDNGRDNVASGGSGDFANKHPIDVTTGDVDGDMMDEVIVAFRIGNATSGDVQLWMLDVDLSMIHQTPWTIDSSVWRNHPIPKPGNTRDKAATAVSVSAADLDGNGADEIALAYNIAYLDLCSGNYGATYVCNGRWQQQLVTYEYIPFRSPEYYSSCPAGSSLKGCFHQRPGTWSSTLNYGQDTSAEGAVVVSTGELDRDTKDEIALAHYKWENDNIEIISFDADTTLTRRSALERELGTNRPTEFWIAMADRDRDTRYATYTGNCYLKTEAQVMSVIFAAPHWPRGHDAANYDQTYTIFDSQSRQDTGESKEVSTSYGASVTVGPSVEGIGASFTYGWEKESFAATKTTASIVHGSKHWTNPDFFSGQERPSFNGVAFLEISYNCFIYFEATAGNMHVCLPYYSRKQPQPHYWWYTTGYAMYPESWVPLGHNLAEGRLAQQSSEDPSYPAPAGRAVDGDVNGEFAKGSVSHTGYAAKPPGTAYWQVDLGGVQWIGAVLAWNRTDACCTNRLKDFYVFISDVPFATANVDTLKNDANIWKRFVPGEAGRPTIIPVDHDGRYVRVQLFGPDPNGLATASNYLDMAELQVYGMPRTPDQWPTTMPTGTGNTFTITWPDPNKGQFTQTVPGQLLGVDADKTSLAPTNLGQETDLGFGNEEEIIIGGSSSATATAGMEILWLSGEVTTTSTEKKSYILTWSNNVGFYGLISGLPTSPATNCNYEYDVSQYAWLQRATSRGGISQAFLVGSFWVPSVGHQGATYCPPLAALSAPGPVVTPAGPVATPAIPVVESPTHPDEDAWVAKDTATFNWHQPQNDSTEIAGYNWTLDEVPDTIPHEFNRGLITTNTFERLADGVFYLHVRAVSTGGQWSETAHRAIRVDANAPETQVVLTPAQPSGDNGWYITPLAVAVSAGDGEGSGVKNIRYSTDGKSWKPYTTPVAFAADTAGTTFYARATDVAGNVSKPVTADFMIDRTPPDSRVSGGEGPGAWVAQVMTHPTGNEVLVLAGAIHEELSGMSGFSLEYNGHDWTGADPIGSWNPFPDQPEIEVNWYFTATHQIGAGNHIFMGRAQDVAGNQEEPYEIARILWYPQDSPNISGSSVAVSPTAVRPGDEVTFTLVARNAGWQEAHVSPVDTLPIGLSPVLETLPEHVSYDPASRTLTWPAQLLWPGQFARYTFQARVADHLAAGELVNEVAFHASWPNTEMLPAEQRRRFEDHEQTVTVSAGVIVDPALPLWADRAAPWAFLALNRQAAITGPVVEVAIPAADDAAWMFLREWAPDTLTGNWIIMQDSGWIGYQHAIDWTLSNGQGVKYLGVWVKDRAGNISTLDENTLAFINRMDGPQALADGERIQYRGILEEGLEMWASLRTLSGDPDVFVWRPRNAFWPDRIANATVAPGQVEESAYQHIQQTGLYLIDIQAFGRSEFEFLIGGSDQRSDPRSAAETKPIPAHPLTVSDPLSAGQTGSLFELEYRVCLPFIPR
jgi:uncharacterized repeat protein (TIGR01451 family)